MESLSPKPVGECSRAKPCTALLDEPEAVLNDRRRWPDHLCYPVMVESCRRWAAENDPDHAGQYPLPLPDGRWAHLALRVRSRRSTLDLFGLVGYKPPTAVVPDAEDYLWVGGLAHVLSGRDDTALLHVCAQAQQWWDHISIEKIRGRPRGSGTHASRDEFKAAVAAANAEILAAGKEITQLEVERQLGVCQGNGRQLRKWLKQYEMSWSEAKKL